MLPRFRFALACILCALVSIQADSSMDQLLIKSLTNCPMCAGAFPCVQQCRITEQKTWEYCLNTCMSDNPLVASTIFSMAQSAAKRSASKSVTPSSALEISSSNENENVNVDANDSNAAALSTGFATSAGSLRPIGRVGGTDSDDVEEIL